MGFFTKKVVSASQDSNDFMQMMGSAKKEVQVKVEANIGSFEQAFQNAVDMLGEFLQTKDNDKLVETGEAFLTLIEQKPSRVEPYVYMAYILFLYGEKSDALKYLKTAESFNPDYEFIKDVKACIYTI